mmetsp:Transcript_28757/g.67824  ORF Transcript_28757/g.67824 Transcript_28757/m.67824 type:complete len:221 (+) Transcript_28757:124-786(+)
MLQCGDDRCARGDARGLVLERVEGALAHLLLEGVGHLDGVPLDALGAEGDLVVGLRDAQRLNVHDVVVVRPREPRVDAALGPPRPSALERTHTHDGQLDVRRLACRLQPVLCLELLDHLLAETERAGGGARDTHLGEAHDALELRRHRQHRAQRRLRHRHAVRDQGETLRRRERRLARVGVRDHRRPQRLGAVLDVGGPVLHPVHLLEPDVLHASRRREK